MFFFPAAGAMGMASRDSPEKGYAVKRLASTLECAVCMLRLRFRHFRILLL